MGEQPEASTGGVALRGSSQRRDVYLTGFGKFGNIIENPTTYIVQKIADDKNVTEALVLEVSAEGSLEMLQPMRIKAEESGRPCIFLHMGVNAGAKKFALEQVGYNVASFRIPDERGWVAKDEIIAQEEGDSLTTALPLDKMLSSLLKDTELVEISTDPGRYICNYVYFHSLRWVKQQLARADSKNEHFALFLHVPQFEVIPIEHQVAFVRKLIAIVAEFTAAAAPPIETPPTAAMSAEAAAQTKATKLAGKDLKDAIKRQVEFYFSRANLANDAFLVSQMNSQMYVPVETIVSFGKIKQLTSSASLVVEAILDSKIVTLNETKDAIKPNLKSERNTIILREIPSATKPEDVQAIFAGCSGEVTSVRSDVGDTWFVTLASEEAAVNTLLELRSKTFNDAPIKARLKSENVLKSFYPAQQVEPVAMAAGGAYSRGYYATGYYDVANSYGPQYASSGGARGGQYSNGAPRQQGGRGGQQFRQNGGGRGGNANANAQAQQPKEARAKSGSFDQQQQRPASRKAKDKKTKASADKQQTNSAAPASGAAPAKKSSAAATAERQPVLNSLNFPPLPVPEKTNPYGEIKFSYAHEDILEIVKHMDETDCKLAEGKMDFEAHSVALTPVAHPDLLRNQRTYSIEQAREALRQGRPIRSDSIGSIDYESMMYGEDYTKEARELRKQKAEVATTDDAKKTETPAKAAAAAPKAAPAQPKVLGYAAAVIHGTPAPQPVVEAKKKTPAAAATAAAAPAAGAAAAAKGKPAKGGKDEKKAPAKKAGKTETAAPIVDETLPKSGAWGGRAFLEVVKSEPVSPPPAPAAVASPSATVKKAVASKEPRRPVADKQ